MNIADAIAGARGFSITWDDQSSAEFPYVWLRDNDPGDLHPDTRERVFDLTSIELPISPDSFTSDPTALKVSWPRMEHPSIYTADWLQQHRPGQRRTDASVVDRTSWNRDSLATLPRCSMAACIADPAELQDALLTLKRYGILLLDGLPDSLNASQTFGDLVGFRRQTNFGDMFEVINLPDPNNLAYTALALPLHTDLPNQEIVPGYQLLHCYRNTTTGGESIFADGLKICEDLQNDAPDDFELFQRVSIPWRFHDATNDIRCHRPIITLQDDGSLDYFAFNAHIADIPDIDAPLLDKFYIAYQSLMKRIRKPRYSIQRALQPGEMIVFDNTRVLHSRAAFDPNSGERHLRGYYIERNEVDSRIRVLNREKL